MISNRCARKSLVTNCNSIISKNYLRFLVDSNAAKIKRNDDSKKQIKKQASNCHKTSFWDYENEKMNDNDNWSDPYGDERAFYDGWSREDVESGLADAYE